SQEPGEPRGLESMRQALEQMRRREEQAERMKDRSRDLERQAREMLERMSPEERERLARWAQEQMREAGRNNPGQPDKRRDDSLPQQPGPTPNQDDALAGSDRPGRGGLATAGGASDDRPISTAPMDIRRSGEIPRVAGEWTRPTDPNDPAS